MIQAHVVYKLLREEFPELSEKKLDDILKYLSSKQLDALGSLSVIERHFEFEDLMRNRYNYGSMLGVLKSIYNPTDLRALVYHSNPFLKLIKK